MSLVSPLRSPSCLDGMNVAMTSSMDSYPKPAKFCLGLFASACIFFCQLTSAKLPSLCTELLTDRGARNGASFLKQKFGQLHTGIPVESTAARFEEQTGKKLSNPSEKVLIWLEYLRQSYSQYRD